MHLGVCDGPFVGIPLLLRAEGAPCCSASCLVFSGICLPGGLGGSWKLLTVDRDLMVAQFSTPNLPPSLVSVGGPPARSRASVQAELSRSENWPQSLPAAGQHVRGQDVGPTQHGL